MIIYAGVMIAVTVVVVVIVVSLIAMVLLIGILYGCYRAKRKRFVTSEGENNIDSLSPAAPCYDVVRPVSSSYEDVVVGNDHLKGCCMF